MRIWIVSELFYPDEISTGFVMTKIAQKLIEYEKVGVICGPISQPNGILKANYSIDERIIIKRINLKVFRSNFLLLKLYNIVSLTILIAAKIILETKKGDKVVMVTNPPTLLPIVSFLKKIKKYNLSIIVHDVFPENAITVNLLKKNSIITKGLIWLFNKSYNSADKIIVVGKDMKKIISSKISSNIPINVITNWADHEEIYPIQKNYSEYYSIDLRNQIVLQFAGNIGRVQGLDHLFKLFAKSKNDDYSVIMIGNGAFKSTLEKKTKKKRLQNIHFIGEKTRDEQLHFLNATHIGIVTLHPGMFGLGVPSKFYNIIAAGNPVLFIGDKDSEIYHYVTSYDIGWAFSWNENDKIVKFIDSLNQDNLKEIHRKGRNARKLVEDKFTRDYILKQYKEKLLD